MKEINMIQVHVCEKCELVTSSKELALSLCDCESKVFYFNVNYDFENDEIIFVMKQFKDDIISQLPYINKNNNIEV